MLVEEKVSRKMPTPTSSSASPASSSPAPRGLRPNAERQRQAAATTAAVASSASPTSAKRTMEATNKTTPPATKTKTNGVKANEKWKERLEVLEESFKVLQEEKESMKGEIRQLRDRLEEREWQQAQLEGKMRDMEEKLKDSVGEEGGGGGGRRGGGGGEEGIIAGTTGMEMERKLEEKLTQCKEVEKRMDEKIEKAGGGGGRRGGRAKKRWVVLTDSNAKDATHHSILNHVPREEREGVEIEVVVVYTLDRAFFCIEKGECDVRGATVVIDALTNDVRGMRSRPAVSPQQMVRLVDRLRKRLTEAGARAVVTCQLKPMQSTDVTPYNGALNDYLRCEREQGRGGYGCRTQIRLDFLRGDGFHIRPEFDSVMDRTYACAFLGIPVPKPTPWDGFVPMLVRQRWENEWPKLVGGRQTAQI